MSFFTIARMYQLVLMGVPLLECHPFINQKHGFLQTDLNKNLLYARNCVATNGYTVGSAGGAGVEGQGKSAGDHFPGSFLWQCF